MFTLSGFADELGPDFSANIRWWKRMGLSFVDIRSAWGINVLRLSPQHVSDIKTILDAHKVKVSCIGSPIGKTYIEDPLAVEMANLRYAVEIAERLECARIRIFSFYSRAGNILEQDREVASRLREMIGYAKDHGIELLHENESGVYGQGIRECVKLASELYSPYFGMVFDPANYSVGGEDALQAEGIMHPFISYVHVKDYSGTGLQMCIPGKGVSRIPEILHRLRDRDLFVSLEPHLDFAGQFGGSTSSENFKEAIEAVRMMLDSLDIAWA